MQPWFSSERQTFRDLSQARRDLIASKALDDGPFFARLWYHHLFWVTSFVSIHGRIYARRPFLMGEKLYCRAADRLFGGTRLVQYFERGQKECEWHMEKRREVKKQQQERDEHRFDRELHYQTLTNPHFVATNHTRQDR